MSNEYIIYARDPGRSQSLIIIFYLCWKHIVTPKVPHGKPHMRHSHLPPFLKPRTSNNLYRAKTTHSIQ